MFPIATAVPYRYPPFVTWSLIGVNVLVFLFQISLPPAAQAAFIHEFALVPARYAQHAGALDYFPFLSNIFLHGGWLHILANMWTLYLFGPAVEDRLGKGRFLLFYLGCGIGASVAHVLVNPASAIPALGASGAIAGVLGAYMRLFPLARVIVLVPILFFPYFFELPAMLFAGLWFLIQLGSGVGAIFADPNAGGVAWWAHIGGFAFGWLVMPLLHRPRHRHRPYARDEGVFGFLPTGHRR
ncbi:MAG: rhomboid family intramembrane serine protease [Rhodothalassiaceae bacterium]